jgi:hypothetical protein
MAQGRGLRSASGHSERRIVDATAEPVPTVEAEPGAHSSHQPAGNPGSTFACHPLPALSVIECPSRPANALGLLMKPILPRSFG